MVYSIVLSRYICIPGTVLTKSYIIYMWTTHEQFAVCCHCVSVNLFSVVENNFCMLGCVFRFKLMICLSYNYDLFKDMANGRYRKCGYSYICTYCGWDLGYVNMCIGVYWYYLSIMHVHLTNDINYLFIN